MVNLLHTMREMIFNHNIPFVWIIVPIVYRIEYQICDGIIFKEIVMPRLMI